MKLVGAAMSLLLSLAVAGCGENPVPLRPTYTQHIQPMMTAHCIRCHGAGGTLNDDPEIPKVTDVMDPWFPYQGAPKNGNLTQLANDAKGHFGLMAYTVPGGLNDLMKAALPFMPPRPSDPLSDWELDTLNTWLQDPR